MSSRQKQRNPPRWLCTPCADIVTNHAAWLNEMWIVLPKEYRSKGGKCFRCGIECRGQKVASVTEDAPGLIMCRDGCPCLPENQRAEVD